MSTPNGARVYARHTDGSEVDVTEGVQALYDIVISSMDWGSGFLTVEEALPVVDMAKTCGFGDWEAAQAYVDARRKTEAFHLELRQAHADRVAAGKVPGRLGTTGGDYMPVTHEAHDHVWPEAGGKCMHPGCWVWSPREEVEP